MNTNEVVTVSVIVEVKVVGFGAADYCVIPAVIGEAPYKHVLSVTSHWTALQPEGRSRNRSLGMTTTEDEFESANWSTKMSGGYT